MDDVEIVGNFIKIKFLVLDHFSYAIEYGDDGLSENDKNYFNIFYDYLKNEGCPKNYKLMHVAANHADNYIFTKCEACGLSGPCVEIIAVYKLI